MVTNKNLRSIILPQRRASIRLPDNKEKKREATYALFCWRQMNGSLNEASVSLLIGNWKITQHLADEQGRRVRPE